MKPFLVALLLALTVLTTNFPPSAFSAEDPSLPAVSRATKEEIKELILKPGFILLDCRPSEQWRASRQKLPGAVHEDPTDVASWAHKYPKDAKIVIY
jgi:hypothetical protein